MCDLDHFKTYNDTYGHGQGDNALQQVAAVLTADPRTEDAAYRYGGEEFVVLFAEEDTSGAVAASKRLRVALQTLGIVHVGNVPPGVLTISVGVASYDPETDLDSNTVLEHADQALYAAKQSGRNRVTAERPRTTPTKIASDTAVAVPAP